MHNDSQVKLNVFSTINIITQKQSPKLGVYFKASLSFCDILKGRVFAALRLVTAYCFYAQAVGRSANDDLKALTVACVKRLKTDFARMPLFNFDKGYADCMYRIYLNEIPLK